jgi:hypothetical protein
VFFILPLCLVIKLLWVLPICEYLQWRNVGVFYCVVLLNVSSLQVFLMEGCWGLSFTYVVGMWGEQTNEHDDQF